MSCCPPNSLPANPTKSDIEATKIGSTNVFFFENPSSTSLVLVFPDLFGTDSGRTKENCAKLSAHYKVALVDLCDDYVTDMSKIPEWIPAHPFDSFVAKVNEVVDHFKTVHGVTKFAAEGYCWGAWVVGKYSAYQPNALSAGISFHPSWGAEQFFNGEGSGAKIAEHITVPQLILAAGNDPDWLKPGGEVEKILESRGIASKLREFPTATHGWVNRGDLNDPVVAKDYHGAWDEESLPFLQKYLA